MGYVLTIQNNASKTITHYKGLDDVADNPLYHLFKNIELDVPDGEYTYYLIYSNSSDIQFEDNPVPMESIVKTPLETLKMKDMRPATGLLRVGNVEDTAKYKKNNTKEYLYRK